QMRRAGARPRVLDVGGRRLNYKIRLASDVTVTEVLRESQMQVTLDLGAMTGLVAQVRTRRSNITDYVIDDMTRTRLPASSFQLVTAIEVLEHVENDAAFVDGVASVLTEDGTFIMTTPSGDYIPIPYKQHIRHYTRD